MRIGLLYIAMIVIGIQVSFGQNAFHRLYPAKESDEQLRLLDAIQLKSGNYVSLVQNKIPKVGNPNFKTALVVTSYTPKGIFRGVMKLQIVCHKLMFY
ncbi:MAG: hypothetical protein IPN86_02445 [Saprospiraceae bacterium]|nr:hypothetical protein [Saprospiraceae bacterium]